MSDVQDAITAAVQARIGIFTVKDIIDDLGWENDNWARATIFRSLQRMERWSEVRKLGLRESNSGRKWREWISVGEL